MILHFRAWIWEPENRQYVLLPGSRSSQLVDHSAGILHLVSSNAIIAHTIMANFVPLVRWVCLLLTTLLGTVSAALQYCHENSHTPVSFCVAIEAWKNTTTSHTDLLITFGHQRYAQDTGWTAFGLGNGMVGALMFVTYAAEGNGELILGNQLSTMTDMFLLVAPILSKRHGRYEQRINRILSRIPRGI